MLGALLVDVGKEVTVERLIDYLWDDDPPRTARSVIQVQISHLRRSFPDVIQTTAGGYLAKVDPSKVDLHRFRDLVARAQSSGDPAEAVVLWNSALSCWRGQPFSGTGSDHLWYSVCRPLIEERWAAVTAWAECAFSLHLYSEIITRLTPLVREDPLRERLHYLLIAALYRSGQRASALTEFHETRKHLAEELGVDPSPDVIELHERILKDADAGIVKPAISVDGGDLRPDSVSSDTGSISEERSPEIVPRNDLPRDIPDFTGRDHALQELLDIGRQDTGRSDVFVITGPGGAGKTTLAVHSAHQLVEHYPDGQLFVDLYGYTVDQKPLEAVAALGILLRAVGVEPDAIPDSVDERSALWRAMLAGKRVLVVLDNAYSLAQVSPLLSAAPGSLTLVTSRHDLAIVSGARYISLGMLDEESSLQLFSAMVGSDRVKQESEQAQSVARLCGGLPLAIRIVGGRMLSRPRWTFAHVDQRLREHQRRFRELRVDGQSVEAVFELSYQSLNEVQQRTFLYIGMMIGSSLDLHGATALLECEPPEADDLLQELVSVCLLEEPVVDVYRFHDLIGAYARQKALALLPKDDVEAARRRMSEHYLDMSQCAADFMGPRGHNYERVETTVSRYRKELATRAEAVAWFDVHQENLVHAVDFFASSGAGDESWQLADAIWRFYAFQGRTELLISIQEKALDISRAQDNERGSAITLIGLGISHCLAGRFELSIRLLTDALDIVTRIGDERGEVRAYGNLSMAYERIGRFHDALSCMWKVLEHAVSVADRELEVMQRTNIALIYQMLGDYPKAVEFCEIALRIQSDDQSDGGSDLLRILGEVKVATGDLDEGFRHLEQSLKTAHLVGSQAQELYARNGLAVALRESGDLDAAIDAHHAALEVGEASAQHSGDAEILNELGVTYARACRYEESRDSHVRALDLARERKERYAEGRALLGLGTLPPDTIDRELAIDHLTTAARIFADLGVPEADTAQAELHHLRGDA
ncbi:AfsR family transcriptional regulator [Nocardiopsis gilva YIM 90087]|uniref:AfsR family transcriptional regulator n=1 Tax=Nocardiopsis gilva YIM 90087 TaxID=1235441 RepID=A0A223S177_9ACTN|nr:AfsR family transcriptional regulator [Nocardiopsis gilva YIM 90087]